MRRFVARHPVLTYYLLVVAISWGGLLLLIGPGNFPGAPADVERLFPLALAALFAGPSLSSILTTALVAGRAGLREHFALLQEWSAGARWFATALLFGPLVAAAVIVVLGLASPAFVPSIVTADDKVGTLLFGLGWGLVGGGLLEELGWTGFAIPRLRRTCSALATGLIVGLLWGLWHLPIAVWGSGGMTTEEARPDFVAGFLAFYLLALPAYRVLMVRVWDLTGSLPVAMLMHALFSTSTLVLQPTAPGTRLAWNLGLAGLLWVIVAAGAFGGPVIEGRRDSAPGPGA